MPSLPVFLSRWSVCQLFPGLGSGAASVIPCHCKLTRGLRAVWAPGELCWGSREQGHKGQGRFWDMLTA